MITAVLILILLTALVAIDGGSQPTDGDLAD